LNQHLDDSVDLNVNWHRKEISTPNTVRLHGFRNFPTTLNLTLNSFFAYVGNLPDWINAFCPVL